MESTNQLVCVVFFHPRDASDITHIVTFCFKALESWHLRGALHAMMRILCYHWRRDTFEILCRFFHADATLKVILDLMLFHMTRSQINDTFLFQSGVKVKVVGEVSEKWN